jgi:hypothetical protein
MEMSYIVFDEEHQAMRIVRRKEEALAICVLRKGWTFKYMKAQKPQYKFEDALI